MRLTLSRVQHPPRQKPTMEIARAPQFGNPHVVNLVVTAALANNSQETCCASQAAYGSKLTPTPWQKTIGGSAPGRCPTNSQQRNSRDGSEPLSLAPATTKPVLKCTTPGSQHIFVKLGSSAASKFRSCASENPSFQGCSTSRPFKTTHKLLL